MASRKPTATGMHTPVTNVTVAPRTPVKERLSPPETGKAAGILRIGSGGIERVQMPPRAEALESLSAPTGKQLPDIGLASFTDSQIILETVHGHDDRARITDTDKYPWRVNASLSITAQDGSQWIGTAWFISPRTLITAGHCVYIKGSTIPNRNGWVKSIQVMPGRDEAKLPFGSATSTQFWTVRGWAENGDENYDYGAIILPTPLGSAVGNYGFATKADTDLASSVANIAGYPGDQAPGTLWYDKRKIAAVNPNKVYYDIDTYGGQSGAAVYVADGEQRIAVAIHAYGGATTNSGTRISKEVFDNLMNWKA